MSHTPTQTHQGRARAHAHFSRNRRIVVGGISLGVATLAAAAAIAAQTHPAAAGALFAAMNSAITCATVVPCVSGANTETGIGVQGTSYTGTAVAGVSSNGDGIDGLSNNAFNTYGVGVKGTTANGKGFGVWGIAGDGVGVAGLAANGVGVYGNAAATGATGTGVLGRGGATSIGVSADNENGGTALQATTTLYGQAISAMTPGGIGVFSTSDSGFGAYLSSNSSIGLAAYTNGGLTAPAVYATNSGAGYAGYFHGGFGGVWGEAPQGGFPLVATVFPPNQKSLVVFDVDSAGDVSYAGSLKSISPTADGTTVQAYSAKTTLPTVEDTGTAQLVGGSASVKLDSTFARTIESAASYHVFITPNGDTHGLFVATKAASGFVVHENQGGRSSVSFDYRIVATALGHAGQRMAVANRAEVMPQVSNARPAMPALKPLALPRLPAMPSRR